MKSGGNSIDAVETAIISLENNPLFNAGKGAVFTSAGKNEMDASIMEGKTLMAGAVAVEIGTAIYYRGIDVFRKVSDEIKLLMEQNGYSTIKQMVGLAHE